MASTAGNVGEEQNGEKKKKRGEKKWECHTVRQRENSGTKESKRCSSRESCAEGETEETVETAAAAAVNRG